MILREEKYELDGKEILLRSANENADDANMLIDYLKTVTGETRFLMCESDEVKYTTEGELSFIKEHNESENGLLILAFVDGEYAGNCSFEGKTCSRRAKHRAGIGIALFQKYTGFGLGRLLLDVLRHLARLQNRWCGLRRQSHVLRHGRHRRLLESVRSLSGQRRALNPLSACRVRRHLHPLQSIR